MTFDVDAQNIITAIQAVSTITSGDQNALNTFVVGCKAKSVWTKQNRAMPYMGNTLAGALVAYNVQTATAFTLTNHNFVSGDYTRTTGLTGDASTKYLQTGYLDTAQAITSWSMGAYQTANPDTGSKAAMGTIISTTQATLLRSCPDLSDGSEFNIGGNIPPPSPLNFVYKNGMLIASRIGTTDTGYTNSIQVATGTLSGSLTGFEEYLFAVNSGGTAAAFSGATQGYAFFGSGLTSTDVLNLTVLIGELQAALGRSTYAPTIAAQAVTTYAACDTTITSGVASGTEIWLAAPGFAVAAAADTGLATMANPQHFSSAEILAQINLWLGNPDTHGNFACFVDISSTFEYQAGDLGNDVTNHHSLGDPIWMGPIWCLDYYNRTGSLTPFTTYKTAMATNLNGVPFDSNHLVFVPNSNLTVWRPWGFQDGIDTPGDSMMGSVFYYMACVAMQKLYTAAADSTNAAIWATNAANIRANISTLYDATSGMFFACSLGGNATNIDIYASALAVYCGLATNAQATTISNYLVANYNTIADKNGFFYESPFNWGQLRSNSPPAVGEYDDGSWSYGMIWVIAAIAFANPLFVPFALQTYADGNQDLSLEWFARPADSHTNSVHTNNLASVAQPNGGALGNYLIAGAATLNSQTSSSATLSWTYASGFQS